MEALFAITADPARDLIRMRMAGFFTSDAIAAFREARRVAHAQLRCGPNQHLTLADVRDMKIQAQPIVAEFHLLLADPTYRSRRIAFVIAPTLARPQLLRAIGTRAAPCFADSIVAEAWLLQDEPDAHAATG